MNEKIKYPDQIRVIKRKGKNLSMRFLLSAYDENSGESPLEFPRYSRFVMSILRTEGGLLSLSANIPQEDLPNIVVRTDLAVLKIMEFQTEKVTKPEKEENTGSKIPKEAYEVSFGFPAELKGKTLAQAISLGLWSKVLEQKKILNSNISRFPANKKTIDAIENVETMLNLGQITETDFQTGSSSSQTCGIGPAYSIYDTDYKYFSKTREDGKNQVYQTSVKCLPGNKYPFVVTIVNAYANVVTTATGGKNITDVTERNSLDIYLTESEWVNMVKRMERLESVFETLHGKSRFEIMKKHSWTPDAQNAKTSSNTSQQTGYYQK